MTLTTHGACGKAWTQRGERTSHCGGCHETFGALSLFDKHRRDGACLPPADGLVQDSEGVWCTPEGIANREAVGIRLTQYRQRANAGDADTDRPTAPTGGHSGDTGIACAVKHGPAGCPGYPHPDPAPGIYKRGPRFAATDQWIADHAGYANA